MEDKGRNTSASPQGGLSLSARRWQAGGRDKQRYAPGSGRESSVWTMKHVISHLHWLQPRRKVCVSVCVSVCVCGCACVCVFWCAFSNRLNGCFLVYFREGWWLVKRPLLDQSRAGERSMDQSCQAERSMDQSCQAERSMDQSCHGE